MRTLQTATDMRHIVLWYERAQIDYSQKYMALFAAFNAWYTHLTGSQNDRQALNILRTQRTALWDAYACGEVMRGMKGPMTLLVELTQREPLPQLTPHWNGEVANIYDWPALLEFWYRVRCIIMHGSAIRPPYVYVAYETLNMYMKEVIADEVL